MYEELNKRRKKGVEQGVALLADFEETTQRPMEVQTELLLDLLRDNKDTEYGSKHDFANITTIEEYQERVPLTTYEDYEEYILRMSEKGERNLLSASDPVWYNKTSGTLGAPKRIPYTQKMRDWFNRYSLTYQNGLLYRETKDGVYGGRTLYIIRCGGTITTMPDGVPYGPISEAGVRLFMDSWDLFFPNPKQAVFAGTDTDASYLNARYALCDRDLVGITCTFTCFLLDFCRYVEKNWELLVSDIEHGTIDESVELPAKTRDELVAGLVPMPERAAELRAIFQQGFNTPFIPEVWPHLNYIAGGASAGFARYTKEVRDRYLGYDVAFFYRGIFASEGVFSVPVRLADHSSALIPGSLFYEFIPVDDEDATPVTMDKIEVGKRYELVVSNHSGFYRYRMRDVLLVTGFHNATPMVEFQYRADNSVSLAGEKTTELALRTSAEKTAEECGFLLVDSSVYPDTENIRYVYVMEIDRVPQALTEEEVHASLERHLAEANPIYGDMVKSGLIKPVKILFSQPETYVLYKDTMLLKGNAIAQLKPVTVIVNDMQKSFFFKLTETFEEIKTLCPME